MDRYAHVNDNGEVVNICLWDGETEYNPSGVILIKDDGNARMGGRWDGSSFTYDEPVEPEPTAEQVARQEKIDSAKAKLEDLGLTTEEVKEAFGI